MEYYGKGIRKMNNLHEMSSKARSAYRKLSISTHDQRNSFLHRLACLLKENAEAIYSANGKDLSAAEEASLPSPLLHRLQFNTDKMNQVISGLRSLAELPDPIGKITLGTEITEGLNLYRVVCPIGVIGVIFESRPDALIQIASLCIKSGNAALLKGGSEAICTNRVLSDLVRKALFDSGLPEDSSQLLETREDVAAMLKEDELIDLIIPRGSNAFVRYIMDNSRIPVLGHSDGICHVYVDRDADPEMAVRIIVDSKTQNVSVCNAMETLLVHKDAAQSILPAAAAALRSKNVEIRGDTISRSIIDCIPASDDDWSSEYLDYILSVKIVGSAQEAVDHINRFGSHHTDCIVTGNQETASFFLNAVDSAGVYWNVSTRFADGYVYGFGAEVGIATGKLHARGPMGLDGLTTYKYMLTGNGHTLAEMKSGECKYTHLPLADFDSAPFLTDK